MSSVAAINADRCRTRGASASARRSRSAVVSRCCTVAASNPHPGRAESKLAAASTAAAAGACTRRTAPCTACAHCEVRCSRMSTLESRGRAAPAGANTCTASRYQPVKPATSSAVNDVTIDRGPQFAKATRIASPRLRPPLCTTMARPRCCQRRASNCRRTSPDRKPPRARSLRRHTVCDTSRLAARAADRVGMPLMMALWCLKRCLTSRIVDDHATVLNATDLLAPSATCAIAQR